MGGEWTEEGTEGAGEVSGTWVSMGEGTAWSEMGGRSERGGELEGAGGSEGALVGMGTGSMGVGEGAEGSSSLVEEESSSMVVGMATTGGANEEEGAEGDGPSSFLSSSS